MSYIWKKDKQEVEIPIDWRKLKASAESEEKAREKLENMLLKEKALARTACQREHENLSGCMATKYASISSVLYSSGFNVRKALEDAVKRDCLALQGKCIKTDSTEIKCETKAEEKAAEEAEAEKDKKKKK
ncbi:MAG: hypothetical protein D6719_06230 [Candidatus Dadabacteria bacterium]|nr:MAG: hypothetical protein D6719_06230 [Candidatus Dadabacteria bacterium]